MSEIKMEDFIKKNILDVVSEKYQYDPESLDYLMNIKAQLGNVMKTVDETIDYMINVKRLKAKRNGVVYPFDEGDDYWAIENGKIVWSCWDYESEKLHDQNPDTKYYMTKEVAEKELKNLRL